LKIAFIIIASKEVSKLQRVNKH